MFDDLLIDRRLNRRELQLVAQAEGLIENALPPLLSVWLEKLDAQIRTVALDLLLHKPQRFLQILWFLAGIDPRALPNPGNSDASGRLLMAIAYAGQVGPPVPDIPPQKFSATAVNLPQGLLQNLRSGKQNARRMASTQIRGEDGMFTESQTLIYLPFVLQNRQALRALVTQADNCDSIFSIERGGSLVADHLMAHLRNGRPNVKLRKPIREIEEKKVVGHGEHQREIVKKSVVYSRDEHLELFKNAIRERVRLKGQRSVTIAVTESLVSGSSANSVLKAVGTLLNEYPNLSVHCLFERHTFHQDNDLDHDFIRVQGQNASQERRLFAQGNDLLRIPRINLNPQRLTVFISKARYILGEDVGYQLSYTGEHAGEPIVIFDEVRGQLRGLRVEPRGGHTAREILVRLVLGAYDDVLAKLGLL